VKINKAKWWGGGGHTKWSQAVNNVFIQTNVGLFNYSAKREAQDRMGGGL